MNLWEQLLIILEQEPVYGLILVLVGSIIIVVNRLRKKDSSKPLFTVFLLSVTIPLLLIKPACTHLKISDDLKPILYFGVALLANDLLDGLGSVLKTLLKWILRKENFNSLVQFAISWLTRMQFKDSTKDDTNNDSQHNSS